MNNLVEIVNLTKKYGANVAVNNLTVSLPKGKIIGTIFLGQIYNFYQIIHFYFRLSLFSS